MKFPRLVIFQLHPKETQNPRSFCVAQLSSEGEIDKLSYVGPDPARGQAGSVPASTLLGSKGLKALRRQLSSGHRALSSCTARPRISSSSLRTHIT